MEENTLRYWTGRIRRDGLTLFLLITIAGFIGLLMNQFADSSLPLVYQTKEARIGLAVANLNTAPLRAMHSEASTIAFPIVHNDDLSLAAFRSFIAQKRGFIIDARSEIFYQYSHIPGALSLPRDDFENSYKNLKARLEANKSAPLAVYCSSEACRDSALVQQGLILLGYTNVFRFTGGWTEWQKAKLPEESFSLRSGRD